MKLIAHRGNISGKNPEKENSPNYILDAMKEGYDVEIDVWFLDGKFYLGHDTPDYEVSESFLRKQQLWCHAKHIESLHEMLKHDIHCFWHQEDDFTLTSKNYIWTYPGKTLLDGSVCVLPEKANYFDLDLRRCYAICSDDVDYYKKILELNAVN